MYQRHEYDRKTYDKYIQNVNKYLLLLIIIIIINYAPGVM